MDEQEFREHVIESLSANTATLASVKENQEKGFKYFQDNDHRIEAESRARDEATAERINKIDGRLTYFAGAGTVVGTGFGFFAKSLLAKFGIHLE